MTDMFQSRRAFLRAGGALAAAMPVAGGFGMQLASVGAAASQSAGDYKALICIFNHGGHDGHNMVAATDTDSWGRYWAARSTGPAPVALMPPGTAPIAVGATSPVSGRAIANAYAPEAWGGVLPITTRTPQPIPAGTNASQRSFGFHPMLAPILPLYQAGRLAVVANVGTLVEPIDRAGYQNGSRRRPPSLGSHNDQEAMWQSGSTEGARFGWGGRMADRVASLNGPNATFTAIAGGGRSVFLSGRSVFEYTVSHSGQPGVGMRIPWWVPAAAQQQMREGARDMNQSSYMALDYARVVGRSTDAATTLNAAWNGPTPSSMARPADYIAPFINENASSLANQMYTVARMIAAAPSMGIRRQVFMVGVHNWDYHNRQNAIEPGNMARLAHGIATLDSLLANVGGADLRSQVTAFTASDFGRTFSTNGDGTDHGWGNHHLVWGGAVRGGDIYGQMPTIGTDRPGFVNPSMLDNILLPTISVDQYAATLGAWFGLSSGDLADIFPNLNRFPQANLGFV
jgi:uncharacterized protein (DUF1501 family)